MCSNPSNKIQTNPALVQNIVARNFKGLMLSARFLGVGDNYVWKHPTFVPSQSLTTIYNSIFPCKNRHENGFRVTCKTVSCGGSTYIISSLTVTFPLNEDATFAVRSADNQTLLSIEIKVKSKLIKLIINRCTQLLHIKRSVFQNLPRKYCVLIDVSLQATESCIKFVMRRYL